MRRRRLAIAAALGACLAAGILWSRPSRPAVENGVALLARGDPAGAVRALAPVVAARPGDPRAHYYLGLAYGGTGARDGAVNQLEEAVRLAPADARFHAELGRAYRDAGHPHRALVELETAVRTDGREARDQLDLGGLLLDDDRVPEATAHLRRAVELAPGAAAARLLLAEALGRLGDRAGMTAQYEDVESLAAADPAAAELARQALRGAGPGTGPCPRGAPPPAGSDSPAAPPVGGGPRYRR